MEDFMKFYSFFSLVFLVLSLKFILFRPRNSTSKLKLPPSPLGRIPVIGHLRLLKQPIHRSLTSLSKTLGGAPIISLRLGCRLVFVVSSYSVAAEECFTKNDVVLANRPSLLLSKYVGYNNTNLISLPYGDLWRDLRRIGAIEIFSSLRLNSFLSVRKDEVRRLVIRVSRAVDGSSQVVEMRPLLADLTFNNIMRMVAGKRYYGEDMEENSEAKHARELFAELGSYIQSGGNLVDYLPFLRFLSSFERKVENLGLRLDAFLQDLIEEKQRQKEKGNTMIDHLLCLQELQPEYYADKIIKGLIMVMLLAGTNTTSVTLEWALSNLLNHPEVLKKARTETDNQIGLDRLMDESDLSKLPYLQNIIQETLRLYPATPLLVPHMASEDCKIAGFDMPRGTTLLVNAWAIQRDQNIWSEPVSFKPERFEQEGETQKVIAFGLGRRACPGSGLAQRLLGLTLGTLIQCFEWERMGEKEVDMTEGRGNTVPRATPLQAICKSRSIIAKVLSEAI